MVEIACLEGVFERGGHAAKFPVLWRKRQWKIAWPVPKFWDMEHNSHAIFALRRRYAHTLGELRAMEPKCAKLKEDLAHLAAVIRMFQPSSNLPAIAPIKPRAPQKNSYLPQALTVLRLANAPMSTREIAKRILTLRGIEINERTLGPIESGLLTTLKRKARDGALTVTERPKRWSVAP